MSKKHNEEDAVCDEITVRCSHRFDLLFEKFDKLDSALRGNGHPGILMRLDRLEQKAIVQSRVIWGLIGATAAGLITALAEFLGK